jgi:hypothetical protein
VPQLLVASHHVTSPGHGFALTAVHWMLPLQTVTDDVSFQFQSLTVMSGAGMQGPTQVHEVGATVPTMTIRSP